MIFLFFFCRHFFFQQVFLKPLELVKSVFTTQPSYIIYYTMYSYTLYSQLQTHTHIYIFNMIH